MPRAIPVGVTVRTVPMQTLFDEAHRVTNIPEAGLKALHRFLRAGADATGADTSSESVGEQQGDGNKAGG